MMSPPEEDLALHANEALAAAVRQRMVRGWALPPSQPDKFDTEPDPSAPQAHAVRIALEAGADPDVRDAAGRTALHHAWSDLVVCELLLSAGADIDAEANDGERPVDVVIDKAMLSLSKSVPAFAFFIARGADLLTPSRGGQRPIDRAMQCELLEELTRAWLVRQRACGVIGEISDEESVEREPARRRVA